MAADWQFGEISFKLKVLESGIQSGTAHFLVSSWRIGHTNQCNEDLLLLPLKMRILIGINILRMFVVMVNRLIYLLENLAGCLPL